jgi:hypothetical protein
VPFAMLVDDPLMSRGALIDAIPEVPVPGVVRTAAKYRYVACDTCPGPQTAKITRGSMPGDLCDDPDVMLSELVFAGEVWIIELEDGRSGSSSHGPRDGAIMSARASDGSGVSVRRVHRG